MGGVQGLVPEHAVDGEILDGGELLLEERENSFQVNDCAGALRTRSETTWTCETVQSK